MSCLVGRSYGRNTHAESRGNPMYSNIVRGNVEGISLVSLTVNLDLTAANGTADHAVSVPGVRANKDMVFVNPLANINTGLAVTGAWVSANDVVTIRTINATAGSLNPAPITIKFLIVRQEFAATSVQ